MPDAMVHRSEEDKRLTASLPLLVVEVLSSNRRTAVHTAGVVSASYADDQVGIDLDALLG